MKMKIARQPLYMQITSVLVSLTIIIYALSVLKDVIVPLTFATILAILLLPISQYFERHRFPRIAAILITLILAISVLVLVGYLVWTQVAQFQESVPLFIEKAEKWYSDLQVYLRQKFNIRLASEISKNKDQLPKLLTGGGDFVTGMLSTTTNFLSNLALTPLYVFLLLLYRDFLRVFLYKLFRNSGKLRIDKILKNIREVLQNYMVGLLLVIGIVGALNTISLFALGIEQAVFFGFFAAFLVLVPYIGVAFGSLLPIMMALITKDSSWYALGVAISFIVIQFLEGNFITPYIVGSKVSINSLMAIIALILFGSLWGIGGLVLALPLTAILKVIFDSIPAFKPYGFLLGDYDHKDVKKNLF